MFLPIRTVFGERYIAPNQIRHLVSKLQAS